MNSDVGKKDSLLNIQKKGALDLTIMKKYVFFARDFFRNSGNYSIIGKHYDELLCVCFRYAHFFSLFIHDAIHPLLTSLEQFRILDELPYITTDHSINNRRLYLACNESYKMLSSYKGNILDINNEFRIEDPVFFRKDGTVFFEAINHEGEYTLYPHDESEICELLKYGHWLLFDSYGNPVVRALDHRLDFPTLESVIGDCFYNLLTAICDSPTKYINNTTIEGIEEYVRTYCPPEYANIPKNIPRVSFTPQWYKSFMMYILAENNSLTNETLSQSFYNAGYNSYSAFLRFFEMLDEFCYLCK